MKCLVCKGSLIDKFTTFMAEVDNCIIIVKNVPSQVCEQCADTSYNHATAVNIEKVVNSLRSSIAEISVTNYPGRIAA